MALIFWALPLHPTPVKELVSSLATIGGEEDEDEEDSFDAAKGPTIGDLFGGWTISKIIDEEIDLLEKSRVLLLQSFFEWRAMVGES